MVSGLDCGLKGPGAFFCNGPNKLMGPQSYFNFWSMWGFQRFLNQCKKLSVKETKGTGKGARNYLSILQISILIYGFGLLSYKDFHKMGLS